jgi:hypothetical protein
VPTPTCCRVGEVEQADSPAANAIALTAEIKVRGIMFSPVVLAAFHARLRGAAC